MAVNIDIDIEMYAVYIVEYLVKTIDNMICTIAVVNEIYISIEVFL